MHRKVPVVLQDAENQLKTERDEFAAKERQFEKELATIHKLAALYKSNSDKRSAEAAELEGVVRDLRQHIQVTVLFVHHFYKAGPLSHGNSALLFPLVAVCCG